MSRLTSASAGLRRSARRINVAGVARVVLVAGAGVALVYVATNRPVSVDLVAATGEQQAPLVGTSLATRVVQTCPGPELAGIPGIPDVPVTSSFTASAGPAELLPVPARGSGRLIATSGASTLLTLDERPGSAVTLVQSTTRVASEVPTSGACCSPVAATRSTETGRFVATYTRPTPAPATSTTRATPATLIRRAVRRRPAPAPVRWLMGDPPGTRGARRGRRGRPARGRPGPDRCATSGRGQGR